MQRSAWKWVGASAVDVKIRVAIPVMNGDGSRGDGQTM
jgi:hypothetical protein